MQFGQRKLDVPQRWSLSGFRAEWDVLSEELSILASWFLSPMSKNSVLEKLRIKRLAVIQEEICWGAFCRWEMLESQLSWWTRRRAECRLHKGGYSIIFYVSVISYSVNITRMQMHLRPASVLPMWCVGSRSSLSRLKSEDRTLEIGATVVKPTDVVRDLGVLLDSELTMKRHVSKMVSTCFYHLRRLRWAAPTPREHWYHKAAGVRLHLQSTRLL